MTGATVALVVEGGDDLDRRAWEERSDAVARGLAARGAGAGTRVGLRFDGRSWADFAVAHSGAVRAGAVAVLFSPGAAGADLDRAVVHSGVAGLLAARPFPPAPDGVWVAHPDELEREGDGLPVPRPGPSAGPELLYPAAPLAPPAPWRVPGTDAVDPQVDGVLVHGWAPGTPGGQWALGVARQPDRAQPVVTLAPFDADRLCALVARHRATACGLTPALAGALVASGAPGGHDVSSVAQVVVSGPPSAGLRDRLAQAFPGAVVCELGTPSPAPAMEGWAPAAVAQEGMLWHEQLAPGSFNLPCLVRRYQGPLDAGALRWALGEMARRHQPLRSTFALAAGRPGQLVGDHRAFVVGYVDLGGLGPRERDAEAARLIAEATSRPFDLAAGPLFEPRLVRLGPDDHLLVVRLHHTVFDDWSVDLFRRELSALYAAASFVPRPPDRQEHGFPVRGRGAPSPLAEPATTFVEACRREQAALAGARGDADRAWWRQELAGAPLAVQLPLGLPSAGDTGGPLRLDLPAPLVADLRALAPRLRATPFMTVLAAFSVLLSRATGQDDLLIATVAAHRAMSDLEPLIGCFTKKVPLRLRLDGGPTFAELVGRARTALLGALAHQDLAFDAALAESLAGPAARHGVVPQVAVVFQAEAPQVATLTMPGLTIGPYEVAADARSERHFSAGAGAGTWGDGMYLGSFLILSLAETPAGLALVARGVFSRPGAQRLLGDFQALLAELVANPTQALGHPAPKVEPDVVDLRGFRVSRRRLEGALAACPGVAEVGVAVRADAGGDPQLVAYVVASDPGRPPALAELCQALWATLPGVVWPAAMVLVAAIARRPDGAPDGDAMPAPGAGPEDGRPAGVLAPMWAERRGRPASPTDSYWQDFSFLAVLAEAREAGLAISDQQVARCRTPAMLEAAMAAERR